MNGHIDFTAIRGDMPDGQRGAFEELVCQLARCEPQVPHSFRRTEGAGGDGGVECLHTRIEGGLVGYQAKYYTNHAGIDWGAIDRSVTTALAIHPNLVTYIVAFACDFTGRRRVRGGGISQGTWGEWDSRVEQWQREAAALGREVEFVPWTGSDILDKLMAPQVAGLRQYWFNATEFSAQWFAGKVELAKADLDERYNPDDHVDVEIQSLFDFITRHPRSREKLASYWHPFHRYSSLEHRMRALEPHPADELLDSFVYAINEILACEQEIFAPIWVPWDVEKFQRLVSALIEVTRTLWRWVANEYTAVKKTASEAVRYQWEGIISRLDRLLYDLDELDNWLKHSYLIAEKVRAAMVEGRAGTGKSHLMGHVADLAILEGAPVVLILGQRLRDLPLWSQIITMLDLGNISTEEFLGALDAAAEARGIRGLILIDALNEGPGMRRWRDEIASFLAQIRYFPNLACVFSCRTEYVPLLPGAVLTDVPRFEIRGFETSVEQAQAARIYMDKRGISRPATPWLAPEFVNPLFLRSCCNALQQENQIEFPRGLTGTKTIFAFYLRSVARHLGTDRDGSNDLVGPTKSALLEIAQEMARTRRDYISRDQAEEIAGNKFRQFVPPANQSWLEILQRNGLLRFDPDPTFRPEDPLLEPVDVIRFSFQRFQDHLMAEALLDSVVDVRLALEDGGPLSFIYTGQWLNWEWQGLTEALSTQVPERFNLELVDALPGIPEDWWQAWGITDAFVESVRWRSNTAFSERTHNLFSLLQTNEHNYWSILVELSASVEHPWNAQLIHRYLLEMSMPERDAFWTTPINFATDVEGHPIHRLIDWCLRLPDSATPETLELCTLVLTWCFTLSSRPLRDRATKALTVVLLAQPDLFERVLKAFEGVDDLYVWERLFASAYGACCIDPSVERLTIYANTTAQTVFSGATPPENILLRDYARGIIELAQHIGALADEIDIAHCRPLYGSPAPVLDVTPEYVAKIVENAGNDRIAYSCYGAFGDFGHYEIEPAVGAFSSTMLSQPPPYTARERYDRFQAEVIAHDLERAGALENLEESVPRPRIVVLAPSSEHTEPVGKKSGAIRVVFNFRARRVQKAEQELLSLLSIDEQQRFRTDALPWLRHEAKKETDKPKQVDVAAAKHWVAKRAYDYGWTTELFPYESRKHFSASRSRALVERIGKKYQWLALSELLCRLADNNWVGGTYAWSTARYNVPPDIGTIRDIDPTVHPRLADREASKKQFSPWMLGPEIKIPEIPEHELAQWPFLADPGRYLCDLIYRMDSKNRFWITLYDHQSVDARYAQSNQDSDLHGLRQQEFRFVYCVLINEGDIELLVEQLDNARTIDSFHWDPREVIDNPYLLEAPWSATWPQQQWVFTGRLEQNIPVAFPLYDYRWESHLDASLPEGMSAFVPAPWLTRELGLRPNQTDLSYRDNSDRQRFISSTPQSPGAYALIDAEMFQAYLDANRLACIWLFIAERHAWPGGKVNNALRRRSEGFCWLADGKPTTVTWFRDWN